MPMTSKLAQFSLGHKLIGDIRGTFVVPRYQRGYRWDTGDVQRLLDDIWKSEGRDYSLQPLVVKRHETGVDEQGQKWELIDGQQRLTTLYLLFFYMQKQSGKKTGTPTRLATKPAPEVLNT